VSPANQTLLARFAVAVSVFALLMVGVVAVRGDSGGGSGGSDAASPPVAVALSEFAISPATITVPTGGSLQVANNGTMVHDLVITDTSVRTAELAAGESEVLDLSSLEPGTYEVFCSIPGHKDSGMVGTPDHRRRRDGRCGRPRWCRRLRHLDPRVHRPDRPAHQPAVRWIRWTRASPRSSRTPASTPPAR
jgi:plastocyanin